MSEPILVYPFHDAPQALRDLSNNGGDEDWIAVVPKDIDRRYYLGWIESQSFGSCGAERIEREHDIVYIGSHA